MTKEQVIAIKNMFKKEFEEEPAECQGTEDFRHGINFALNYILIRWDGDNPDAVVIPMSHRKEEQ